MAGLSRLAQLDKLPRCGRQARARRLAPRQHQQVPRATLLRGESRKAVCQSRAQSVWNLAPKKSPADPGHGRICGALRRFEAVVPGRLGGLPRPATLLADARAESELCCAPYLVVRTKPQKSTPLARRIC